jgi:hypothetical protein
VRLDNARLTAVLGREPHTGTDCYDPKNFNDKVVFIAITNYGVKGVVDNTFYRSALRM